MTENLFEKISLVEICLLCPYFVFEQKGLVNETNEKIVKAHIIGDNGPFFLKKYLQEKVELKLNWMQNLKEICLCLSWQSDCL